MEDEIRRQLSKRIDDLFMETMLGGKPKNQRQTALRALGSGFETVELDDDGKVIEPVRCTCGHYAVFHRANCPFAYAVT